MKIIKRILKGFRFVSLLSETYFIHFFHNKNGNDSKTKIFENEFEIFTKLAETSYERFNLRWKDKIPCLNDKTNNTFFDIHYIYHTAWAARCVKLINPPIHFDISSYIYFSTILSAFVPVEFYDFRPANIKLSNYKAGSADLCELPFKSESVQSLSCLHVVEHIGLGRYGDPIDYDGDLKAMDELCRVLAINGNLLLVVPVGSKSMIQFNAHRIYTKEQIVSKFVNEGLTLREFILIPDNVPDGILIPNPPSEILNKQRYACGCFWFVK